MIKKIPNKKIWTVSIDAHDVLISRDKVRAFLSISEIDLKDLRDEINKKIK